MEVNRSVNLIGDVGAVVSCFSCCSRQSVKDHRGCIGRLSVDFTNDCSGSRIIEAEGRELGASVTDRWQLLPPGDRWEVRVTRMCDEERGTGPRLTSPAVCAPVQRGAATCRLRCQTSPPTRASVRSQVASLGTQLLRSLSLLSVHTMELSASGRQGSAPPSAIAWKGIDRHGNRRQGLAWQAIDEDGNLKLSSVQTAAVLGRAGSARTGSLRGRVTSGRGRTVGRCGSGVMKERNSGVNMHDRSGSGLKNERTGYGMNSAQRNDRIGSGVVKERVGSGLPNGQFGSIYVGNGHVEFGERRGVVRNGSAQQSKYQVDLHALGRNTYGKCWQENNDKR